jgi:hypothetical protein
MADATIAGGVLFDWTALNDTASDTPGLATGELDLGDGIVDVTLSIITAHTDANTVGAGLDVNVEVYGRKGALGENYQLLGTLSEGGTTSLTATMDAAIDADGGTGDVLPVDATTVFDENDAAIGRLFLLDATLLNSEMVKIIGWVDGASFKLSQLVTLDHADTGALFQATEQQMSIPNGIRYIKVVWNNKDDDANYAVQVSYSGILAYV